MSDDDTRWVAIQGPTFAQIPESLIFDPTISDAAIRVYAILIRHGQVPENCYPSHARIASKMGASKRSVPKWITELCEAGWIEKVPRTDAAGDPTSNGYIVRTALESAGYALANAEGYALESAEGYALESAPKESHVEREQEENDITLFAQPDAALARRDLFDDFWAAYPNKKDKKRARLAWARAIKEVDPSVLVAAAQRYRDDPNRSDEFTKMPTTWLNAGSWENGPLPSRGRLSSTKRAIAERPEVGDALLSMLGQNQPKEIR